jgi:hypothetical protein
MAHVIGVAGRTPAGQLGVDRGVAAFGALQFFEHEHAASLADDKAVALGVKRAGSHFRFVVPVGDGIDEAERDHDHRVNRRVGTAGEHHVGVAAHDGVGGVRDGGGRAIAAGRDGDAGRFQAEVHRDEAAAGTSEHGDAEMGEPVHASDFLGTDPAFGVEVLDLGGDFPRAVGVDENRRPIGAGDAGDDVSPEFLHTDADGTDNANARDDDSSLTLGDHLFTSSDKRPSELS